MPAEAAEAAGAAEAAQAAGSGTPEQVWRALGLSPVQGEVLGRVLAGEEVTQAQVVEATGLSASGVSRALAALEREGLLDRVPGRRPTVLFLHRQADVALGRLIERARVAEQEVHASRERLRAVVAEGVVRAEERGRRKSKAGPAGQGKRYGIERTA